MKRFLLIFACCYAFVFNLSSQDYNTGIGLRLSPSYGINVKHFIQEDVALEFILMTRESGFNITGLYEVHTQAFETERLQAFGGIGLHGSVFDRKGGDFWDWTGPDRYNNGNHHHHGDDDDDYDDSNSDDIWAVGDNSRIAIGMDLILGLEYSFNELPFAVSLDWKPAVNFIGDHGAVWNQVALSARFTLK